MGVTFAFCRVLDARISLVSRLDGEISSIVCPEYEPATGGCRVKQRWSGGGPLSALLERAGGDTRGSRSTRCEFDPGTLHSDSRPRLHDLGTLRRKIEPRQGPVAGVGLPVLSDPE